MRNHPATLAKERREQWPSHLILTALRDPNILDRPEITTLGTRFKGEFSLAAYILQLDNGDAIRFYELTRNNGIKRTENVLSCNGVAWTGRAFPLDTKEWILHCVKADKELVGF